MAFITYLTRIQIDSGALKLLDAELQLLGIRRPIKTEYIQLIEQSRR